MQTCVVRYHRRPSRVVGRSPFSPGTMGSMRAATNAGHSGTGIAVFCGGRLGEPYVGLARSLGAELASRRLQLIFGGSTLGLMGEVAGANIGAGGEPTGVLPSWLQDVEPPFHGCRIELVPTLAARKTRFLELSSAFIVLPGGMGTLDELFEVLTHRQLGRVSSPIALLDAGSFWDPLLEALRHASDAGFIDRDELSQLRRFTSPQSALDYVTKVVP